MNFAFPHKENIPLSLNCEKIAIFIGSKIHIIGYSNFIKVVVSTENSE